MLMPIVLRLPLLLEPKVEDILKRILEPLIFKNVVKIFFFKF